MMDPSGRWTKHVPYGMSERNVTIHLEKYNTDDVKQASKCKLK